MDARSFFDQYAERWDEMEVPDIQDRVERVVRLAEIADGHDVLDVGCGTGVMVPALRVAIGGRGRIVAFDLSLGMLKVASSKGLGDRVQFLRADASEAPFCPGVFDAVVCNAVYPHFADRSESLKALIRCLKPGGRLVVSHPIGREAVNRIHSGHDEVAEDAVPDAGQMATQLAGVGLTRIRVIDEAEFYYADGVCA